MRCYNELRQHQTLGYESPQVLGAITRTSGLIQGEQYSAKNEHYSGEPQVSNDL